VAHRLSDVEQGLIKKWKAVRGFADEVRMVEDAVKRDVLVGLYRLGTDMTVIKQQAGVTTETILKYVDETGTPRRPRGRRPLNVDNQNGGTQGESGGAGVPPCPGGVVGIETWAH
jgi:hypothetical protein